MALRTGLGVVLAEVGVVGGNETNDGLLALVADINTYEHCLRGDFLVEVHSPQITTKLHVDLTDDVHVDPVVVSVDRLVGHELRDNGVVGVDLVLDGLVEELLPSGVRDND